MIKKSITRARERGFQSDSFWKFNEIEAHVWAISSVEREREKKKERCTDLHPTDKILRWSRTIQLTNNQSPDLPSSLHVVCHASITHQSRLIERCLLLSRLLSRWLNLRANLYRLPALSNLQQKWNIKYENSDQNQILQIKVKTRKV
jgi:hypothetical protein